jgi:hypothetical protein
MNSPSCNLELDSHGEILFADRATFKRLLRYSIANGDKRLYDDLTKNFSIEPHGAFRIQHAPTLAATGARG